ncbi:hypothetical protein [Saccharopolyspora sp. ASAGF58]|uniref:hypothetical protein n=1 Tax=Saccharopolyspora sp. ASAGF58 TaxID=2719023 RepID=UPI00144019B2|nr:hypothetical protein [Saccharopolyspora sp. ASAGF58]QIZ36236.1 hypothetical protein FDZ84_18070 [Saccharopolyspora sp. ASAGF58]
MRRTAVTVRVQLRPSINNRAREAERADCNREAGNVEPARQWHVSCRDVAGRRRDMSVLINQGNVVVIAPAGETAVLSPLEVGRLRAALRDAIVVAAAME